MKFSHGPLEDIHFSKLSLNVYASSYYFGMEIVPQ